MKFLAFLNLLRVDSEFARHITLHNTKLNFATIFAKVI